MLIKLRFSHVQKTNKGNLWQKFIFQILSNFGLSLNIVHSLLTTFVVGINDGLVRTSPCRLGCCQRWQDCQTTRVSGLSVRIQGRIVPAAPAFTGSSSVSIPSTTLRQWSWTRIWRSTSGKSHSNKNCQNQDNADFSHIHCLIAEDLHQASLLYNRITSVRNCFPVNLRLAKLDSLVLLMDWCL